MPDILGHECYFVNTAPEAYDIIWANFPYDDEPYNPGPDRHPCLVLNKKVFSDKKTGKDYATLQVMYGTSSPQKGKRNVWEYLHVHNFNALTECGLFCETYFIVERTQRLFWCKDYMPYSEQGSPILGKLPMEYIMQLKLLKKMRDEVRKLKS